MRASAAFLALAVLATVAAAALALPAAGLAEAADEVLRKEGLTEDDVNALPKVGHSEDAKVGQSKDTVDALPMAVPSKDAVDLKPKAVPSQDAVDAKPKAVPSKDAVDAKRKAGLRMERLTEDTNFASLPARSLGVFDCHRGDRSEFLNDCIKSNLQAVAKADSRLMERGQRTYLKWLFWLLGLPDLEPYFVPEVKLNLNSYTMKVHGTMSNVSVMGLTKLSVVDARANLTDDAMDLEVDVIQSLVVYRGWFNYTKIYFDNYKFYGNGPFEFAFRNITSTWSFLGKKEPGSKHMTIVKASPEYSVGDMKISMENCCELHQNSIERNTFIDFVFNIFINAMWKDVLRLGEPNVQKDLSEHLKMLSNRFFQRFTYDELFPPGKSKPMVVDVVYRSGTPV